MGSRVKAGQLLVTLDPTQYNQQRLQYQTALDDYNRLVPVYEAGGISAQQLEQTKAALDVQKEVLDNLKKNIEMPFAHCGRRDGAQLRSGQPVHGDAGAARHADQSVEDHRQHSGAVLSRREAGDACRDPHRYFPRRSVRGQGVADLSGARRFDADLHRRGDRSQREPRSCVPGMFARSTFNMGDKEGIMVPDVAVLKQVGSSERYLYVVKDGKAERRSVKVGRPDRQRRGHSVGCRRWRADRRDGAFTTGRRRRSGGGKSNFSTNRT